MPPVKLGGNVKMKIDFEIKEIKRKL